MATTMPVQELLYEATFQTTEVIDFGLDMQSVMSGQAPMPPEGLRLDFHFSGEIRGEKLGGKLQGVDYVLMRADGLVQLHVHAIVTTDDGERIAYAGEGLGIIPPGATVGQLREHARLHTASAKYGWLNHVQLYLTGEADLATGVTKLRAYVG
jgi:hypothetical protein